MAPGAGERAGPGEAPGSGDGSQHFRDDQDELDERGIGMAVAEVVGLPMSAFTSRTRALGLPPREEAFVKSLRRRIKNRMASQNSRRRNTEHLRSLSDELRAARATKRRVLEERAALAGRCAHLRVRLRALHDHLSEKLTELSDGTELPFRLDPAPTTARHTNQVFQTNNPTLPKTQPQSLDVNICNIKKEIFECSIENLVRQSVNHMFKFDRSKCNEPVSEGVYPKVIDERKIGRRRNAVNTVKNIKRRTLKPFRKGCQFPGKNVAVDITGDGDTKEKEFSRSEQTNLATDLFAQNLVKSIVSDARNLKRSEASSAGRSADNTDSIVAEICRANNLVIRPCRKKPADRDANTNGVAERKRETFEAKIMKLKKSEAEFIKNIESLKEMPPGQKRIRAKCVAVVRDDSLAENGASGPRHQARRNGCIKHTSQVRAAPVEALESAEGEEVARYCNVFLTNGGGVSVRAAGAPAAAAGATAGALNLSVREAPGARRRQHGRKQAAPRRIAHAPPAPEDFALDLKMRNNDVMTSD